MYMYFSRFWAAVHNEDTTMACELGPELNNVVLHGN